MDKLESYCLAVKKLFHDINKPGDDNSNRAASQLVFDTEQHHYLLMNVGWIDERRNYGCVLHIDVSPDEKVWVQHNGTELQIADELIARGVAKEDIVLGFHSPYKRQFSGFAVG